MLRALALSAIIFVVGFSIVMAVIAYRIAKENKDELDR